MASQKITNCCVGVCAYLRGILRHGGVPYVRLIPQDPRLAFGSLCLAISFDDFLWDQEDWQPSSW